MQTFSITIDNSSWSYEGLMFDYRVLSWSWDASIGPDEASIEVFGREDDLPACWRWMGSGITISDMKWGPLWWGTIEEVEIHVGKIKITKTLNTVVNDITVVYVDSSSLQASSYHAADFGSQNQYGLRVQTYSLPTANSAQAQSIANVVLQNFKDPKVRIDPGTGDAKAILKARGLIHRLGFRYYSNATLTLMDASSAIQTILTAPGIFPEISGVDIIDYAGVSVPIFTAVNRTAKDRIMELLKSGTSTGQRLLLTISPSKIVSIYKQPAAPPAGSLPQFLVTREGAIWETNEGDTYPVQRLRAGMWIGIKDISWARDQLAFVERSTFSAQNWQWSWQPYLQVDPPKELVGMQMG